MELQNHMQPAQLCFPTWSYLYASRDVKKRQTFSVKRLQVWNGFKVSHQPPIYLLQPNFLWMKLAEELLQGCYANIAVAWMILCVCRYIQYTIDIHIYILSYVYYPIHFPCQEKSDLMRKIIQKRSCHASSEAAKALQSFGFRLRFSKI